MATFLHVPADLLFPNATHDCDPITEDVGPPAYLVGGREGGLQGITTERRISTLHVEDALFNGHAGGAPDDVLSSNLSYKSHQASVRTTRDSR